MLPFGVNLWYFNFIIWVNRLKYLASTRLSSKILDMKKSQLMQGKDFIPLLFLILAQNIVIFQQVSAPFKIFNVLSISLNPTWNSWCTWTSTHGGGGTGRPLFLSSAVIQNKENVVFFHTIFGAGMFEKNNTKLGSKR